MLEKSLQIDILVTRLWKTETIELLSLCKHFKLSDVRIWAVTTFTLPVNTRTLGPKVGFAGKRTLGDCEISNAVRGIQDIKCANLSSALTKFG